MGECEIGGCFKKEFIIIAIAIMGYLIPGVSLFQSLFIFYIHIFYPVVISPIWLYQ